MGYVTISEATAWLSLLGINQFEGDEVVLTQCIYRASVMIDNLYGARYPGILLTNDQSLLWPRTTCLDKTGRTIYQGTIPDAIKSATCILAQAILHNKDLSSTPALKSERSKVGPIEEEFVYATGASAVKSASMTDVELYLSSLIGPTTQAKVIPVKV